MKAGCRFSLLGVLLMCFSFGLTTSCSKDDGIAKEPAGTITLNMLNEKSGNTHLGTSDVYINEANNFSTSLFLISDVGKVPGVGSKVKPLLNNLAKELAVIPGNAF